MGRNLKKLLIVLLVLGLVGGIGYFMWSPGTVVDPFVATYMDNCADCHGDDLQGQPGKAASLLGGELAQGDSVAQLSKSIAHGVAGTEMTGWSDVLSPTEIRSLAIYVAERRVDRLFTDFKTDAPVAIPTGVIATQLQDFRFEVVTDQLDPLPFSIAHLPDGRMLVTEKQRGLRIVDTQGNISPLIEGTPEVFDDSFELILVWGHGWLLDIALHPDYENNGWIYLHHTQRCPDCWFIDRSFNRVVRRTNQRREMGRRRRDLVPGRRLLLYRPGCRRRRSPRVRQCGLSLYQRGHEG